MYGGMTCERSRFDFWRLSNFAYSHDVLNALTFGFSLGDSWRLRTLWALRFDALQGEPRRCLGRPAWDGGVVSPGYCGRGVQFPDRLSAFRARPSLWGYLRGFVPRAHGGFFDQVGR